MTGVVLAGTVGLAALVWKLTDFLRLVVNLSTERSAVLTQLSAWAAGVGAVWLYGASQFGGSVVVEGLAISAMSGPTKVLVGITIASLGSALVDVKQAVDGSDSSTKPPLAPVARRRR